MLLPAGMVLALTIPLAGRLADHWPVSRLVTLGVLLLAASFWLMLWVGLSTSLWIITGFAIVGRIGLGFVLPSLNLGAMRGLPPALISQGASGINFLRQLGGAVGVNLVGTVLAWRLQVHVAEPVRAFHETFGLLASITMVSALAAWRMKPTPPS